MAGRQAFNLETGDRYPYGVLLLGRGISRPKSRRVIITRPYRGVVIMATHRIPDPKMRVQILSPLL